MENKRILSFCFSGIFLLCVLCGCGADDNGGRARSASASANVRRSAPAVAPVPKALLDVRVITPEWICVAGDYSEFTAARIEAECGAFLRRIDDGGITVRDWSRAMHYNYAAAEVLSAYRPGLVGQWAKPDFFRVEDSGGSSVGIADSNFWFTGAGQLRIRKSDGTKFVSSLPALGYFSYLRLKTPLSPGAKYRIVSGNGDVLEFDYRDREAVSHAIKVNQVGYLASAGRKYAYLNMWLGPGKSLDVEQFAGREFQIVEADSGKIAFRGRIASRSPEQYFVNANGVRVPVNGGDVMEMDFSAFNTPGRYYLFIPGVGRSWPFSVGEDVLNNVFYTHARGFYHQRCGVAKERPYTAWAMGACHETTRRGGFSPHDEDYRSDSRSDGGYFDGNGRKLGLRWFDVVAATAEETVLPGVKGGWHDAADFDRRTFHLRAVFALLGTYLLAPGNFVDGQLNLPESGNGVADLLDEVKYAMELWRAAQLPSGGVGTWVEATSHPRNPNPASDQQKYYLSLATRNSSMEYAAAAAEFAVALRRGGDRSTAELYLQSAQRAFAFAVAPENRAQKQFAAYRYQEKKKLDPAYTFKAAMNLNALGAAGIYTPFLSGTYLNEAMKQMPYPMSFLFLAELGTPEYARTLPDAARLYRRRLREVAEQLLVRQEKHAFRHLHFAPDNGKFRNLAWGNANPLRYAQTLAAAYRVFGENKYRDGALLANDWTLGANPTGRGMTTGLGANYPVRGVLYLPCNAADWSEPPPGITPYTFAYSISKSAFERLWALRLPARKDHAFAGVDIGLFPGREKDDEKTLRAYLNENYPVWHRYEGLEAYGVIESEFSVWETISDSAAATGALLPGGFLPSAAALRIEPASDATRLPGYLAQP